MRLLDVVLILGIVSPSVGQKHVLVQTLCRHGDRAPDTFYPNYPQEQRELWIQGPGALTPLGMRQCYDNGIAFKKRYPDLLSEIFEPNQTKVISSNIDRAIQSADAFLAGLYPPVGAFKFEPNINWQPLPVHSISPSLDFYLYGHFPCPTFWEAVREVETQPAYLKFLEDNMEFMDSIKELAGFTQSYKSVNAMSILDYDFVCNTAHNLSLPWWATPEVVTRIRNIVTERNAFWYASPKLTFLDTGGGPLLGVWVNNILEKIHGRHNYSFMAYSAHDTTMFAFAGNLGLPGVGPVPPYASCWLLELNQNITTDEYYLNLYFKNTTVGFVLQPYTIPACGEFNCPLDKALKLAIPRVNSDPSGNCQELPGFDENLTMLENIVGPMKHRPSRTYRWHAQTLGENPTEDELNQTL